MKNFRYLVFFFLILGCNHNTVERPKKPNNLISEDKMVEVLYDMALISSAKGVGRRTIENKGLEPEAFIYNKHQIDSVQFKESNAYYSYDISTYEAIYTKVKEKLEQDKKKFQAILDEEKRKRDSIAKRNRQQDSIARLKRNRSVGDSAKLTNPDRISKDDKSQQ